MTLSSPVAAQDFDKGWAAYQAEDYSTAYGYWRPLADTGNPKAQFWLGLMHYNGHGLTQSYKDAIKWWELAAQKGYPAAQGGLGYMYRDGKGLLQDNVIAHMWFNIATTNGNKDTRLNRDKIAKEMTPAAIQEAQAMARECMSSSYTKCGE